MSQNVGPDSRSAAGELDVGFDGRRGGFRTEGRRRPPHEHDNSNGHFAVVHETAEERFEAVRPFVKEGLDRGEKCLYVLTDHGEDVVVQQLEREDIDVRAALETGALTFHTVEETYLRERPFDPDRMISFYERVIAGVEEYEGLRIVAGTNWIGEVDLDTFMEYEGRVNALFDETDSMALCLYDRSALRPDVVADVIRTHPHLISDGTISHNVYYTPADELSSPHEPTRRVDRMLATLNGRARARNELAVHKRFLRELNEITSDPERPFEEKLQDLFDLGCDWFDMELGAVNRVDPESDWLEVEHINGYHEYYQPGEEFPLTETYCVAASDIRAAASISDPPSEGYGDLAVFQKFGVSSYLGTYLPIDGGDDRTFAFISPDSRSESFSADDHAYIELMGEWVKSEIERDRYEDELEATIDQLQQSNDRLKQFAYAASHDLQEPLRMVSSYLRLLEDEYGDELDADAREYVDVAVNGAYRMRQMVDDLLAYSRVEAADGEFEPVDCDGIVERSLDDLEVTIAEREPEISVGSLPTVAADDDQLEQLFTNLISNALKYNEAETPLVEIAAEERSDRWEFVVSDNGIGIDPDRQDRIFEVFRRLHNDDEYPGTGIGLALCQEIVENHGGDIRVESAPGEGTTVYFTLPDR